MAAETGVQEFRRVLLRIADHARHDAAHDPRVLAITVAQMLAAIRLAPHEAGGAMGFRDGARELTRPEWSATLDRLRDGAGGPGSVLSSPDRPFSPGTLERIRRELLAISFMEEPAGRSGRAAPGWMLRAVLDFANERSHEVPTVSSDVRTLVVDAVGIAPGERLYCAYAGAAGVAIHHAAELRSDVLLEIRQADFASFCAWLSVAGDLPLEVRVSDPLHRAATEYNGRWEHLSRGEAWNRLSEVDDPNGFDAAVVHPPFNEVRDPGFMEFLARGTHLPHAGTMDGFHIMLALARGKRAAVCIVPNGFLFRAAKADQVFKEDVVRRHGLGAVVGLPRSAFGRHTSVSGSLLVFRSDARRSETPREPDVLMVDARGADAEGGDARPARILRDRAETEISTAVSAAAIAGQDFNLTVDRYVLDPEVRRMRDMLAHAAAVPLDDVAELYRPQALPAGGRGRRGAHAGQAPEDGEDGTFLDVGVADIDEAGLVREPTKAVPATRDVAQQARRARLEAGDVLLVIKGSVGKVGYVRHVPDGHRAWLASQSFAILRLRRRGPISDPLVLFRFLSSSLGQTALRSLAVGTAIPGLQMADVRRLPVLVPPDASQAEIAGEVRGLFEIQDRIQAFRRDLEEKRHAIWPDRNGAGAEAEAAARKE